MTFEADIFHGNGNSVFNATDEVALRLFTSIKVTYDEKVQEVKEGYQSLEYLPDEYHKLVVNDLKKQGYMVSSSEETFEIHTPTYHVSAKKIGWRLDGHKKFEPYLIFKYSIIILPKN